MFVSDVLFSYIWLRDTKICPDHKGKTLGGREGDKDASKVPMFYDLLSERRLVSSKELALR